MKGASRDASIHTPHTQFPTKVAQTRPTSHTPEDTNYSPTVATEPMSFVAICVGSRFHAVETHTTVMLHRFTLIALLFHHVTDHADAGRIFRIELVALNALSIRLLA